MKSYGRAPTFLAMTGYEQVRSVTAAIAGHDRWFGKANMSSGCTGMSDANAAWFYDQVRPGDPFEIKGKDTKGVVAPGNGFGAWNVPWAQWRAKSALG
jgi:hypothetical protein